jgi:alpha-L-fucosidase
MCLLFYFNSFGGNILINVGATSWGTFAPIYEERFRQLGSWLKVNGEAIYKSTPWKHQNDTLTKRAW